jgi:predicted O-methyltransferase YrrM
MSSERWGEVDHYIGELFVGTDGALEAALRTSAEEGLPQINVSPPQGKLLALLARSAGARSILEIGTLGGYSTIWLARALPPGGRLVTLELDAHHAEVARTNIARAGLSQVVELRVGAADETLDELVAKGDEAFDLVFIDADKDGYPKYLEKVLALVRPGALIVGDNVVRDGAVIDVESDDPNVRGVRRFNELLAADPRLSATVIQTVGSKGYDGFALALVTA